MPYLVQLFKYEPAKPPSASWKDISAVVFQSDLSEERIVEVVGSLKNSEHPGCPHNEMICTEKCFPEDPEIHVEITATPHGINNGYDLMLKTGSHGWAKGDLTIKQLVRIHEVIGDFLDSKEFPEKK